MKVLHVIPTLDTGGAEKMIIDIIREMQNQGVNCELAVLTKVNNFFGADVESLGISVHYGPTEKVYSFSNIFFLRSVLLKNSYDIVHTHLYAPQLFLPLALLGMKKKFKLVTTEHNTHNKRRNRKEFYLLDNWMYRQYSKIIAISKDTKENLSEYLPNTETKTVIIENGIEVSNYSKASKITRKDISPEIKVNDKLILMVAAMREQKDHETLIRASRLLPDNYRVIFVGDGEKFEEVQQYAKEYGAKSILFLGNRKDVPQIMKSSDVFVLSSKWEGFGLVVVEAAAAGIPVITSNVYGMNEVVRTIGGQLFTPFDERDLANNILLAMENNNTKYDVSKYTIQTTVIKYLQEVYVHD